MERKFIEFERKVKTTRKLICTKRHRKIEVLLIVYEDGGIDVKCPEEDTCSHLPCPYENP